jgi:hypothetical protein
MCSGFVVWHMMGRAPISIQHQPDRMRSFEATWEPSMSLSQNPSNGTPPSEKAPVVGSPEPHTQDEDVPADAADEAERQQDA